MQSDNQEKKFVVRPLGRFDGYFVVNKVIYRRFTLFTWLFCAIILCVGTPIWLVPQLYDEWLGWPPGLDWLVLIVVAIIGEYGRYNIASAGERVFKIPAGLEHHAPSAKLGWLAFLLVQLSAWCLIIMFSVAVWVEVQHRLPIPAWQIIVFVALVYAVWWSIRRRK